MEGTHEGLAAAKARGVRLGRPPAMTPEQVRHARALLTQPDATVSSIARLLNVSRSTIYKCRRRGAAAQQHPGRTPRYLFCQRTANANATKPYSSSSYSTILRDFSKLVQITDSKGNPVRLSHTHRFRHTRLTKLAELGLPIHVLQRYAGHANPTMSMHYVAQREEHAEQAFLATRTFKPTAPASPSPAKTTTECTCLNEPTVSCPTATACSRHCRPARRATPA
ncbi:tyrosine-type recombinase/integrase [Nonomuraea sp. NPDC005983]|uniref:tyrosine-type recombinase/integrase n=1 Tax=Nonomuraea sp. NPDC005983 TaxID=3155595 RepID=UPI00339F5852